MEFRVGPKFLQKRLFVKVKYPILNLSITVTGTLNFRLYIMNLLPPFNPITPIQTISLFLLFVIWPFLSHDHEICSYGLGTARSTSTSLAILNYFLSRFKFTGTLKNYQTSLKIIWTWLFQRKERNKGSKKGGKY